MTLALRRGTILCGMKYVRNLKMWIKVVSEYSQKLLELISPHEPKNIYNADKTEFFLGITNKKSAVGTKRSKKDLQCYCVGIWWEKWKSLP
jgi:hypothetical protein